MRRRIAIVASFVLSHSLGAQCPDGSPQPCARPPVSGVAVLYFENASRDTSYAYLADGLTESLIDRLAQVGIHVASRFQVRRVANMSDPVSLTRALGVDHVLTGTVRRIGSALRVSVELARLPSGARVWGREFNRQTDDLLTIETEIATTVADSVAGRLQPRQRRAISRSVTANPAAYYHFQRGKFFYGLRTSESILRATQELETATRLDPRSAQMQAQLSLALQACARNCRIVDSTRPTTLRRSLRAADAALRLDSSGAPGWTAMASAVLAAAVSDIIDTTLSMPAAAKYAARAIALDSNYAEAWHALGDTWLLLGDEARAEQAFTRALALEPGNGEYLHHLSRVAILHRDFVRALVLLDSAKASEPGFSPTEIAQLQIRTLVQLGQPMRARAILSENGFAQTVVEVQVLVAEGDTTAARAALDKLPKTNWAAARGHALMGDAAGAVERLSHYRGNRIGRRFELRWPDYDRIRADPAFQRLLKESDIGSIR
jgi:TolB-like protein/tetratricopeptide (TPR) repeat protein